MGARCPGRWITLFEQVATWLCEVTRTYALGQLGIWFALGSVMLRDAE